MKTVRILPMNHELEFNNKNIEEVQNEFFLGSLKNGYKDIPKGVYYYRTKGLSSKDGDLILFQMDNQIIASAIFQDSIPFERIFNDIKYNGELWVHQDTIKIFNPISNDELQELIPDFKRFGDTKYCFDLTDEEYNILVDRTNQR